MSGVGPIRSGSRPFLVDSPASSFSVATPVDRLVDARRAPPLLQILRSALEVRMPPTELAAIRTFTRAGLSIESAVELARGVDADRATDMLALPLVTPSVRSFGPALVTLRVLNEARAAGGITAARVKQLVAMHEHMLVVRPDGYLARALDGAPIEKAADLEVGRTYHVDGGVLYESAPAIDRDAAPIEPQR